MTKLEFHKERHGADTWVYTAGGDLFGSPEGYGFQDDVRREIQAGCRRFVVELAGITRIDSSGVGILVAMLFSASHAGGAMVLAALSPRVEKVLGIAMLLDHVSHAPTLQAALERLPPRG